MTSAASGIRVGVQAQSDARTRVRYWLGQVAVLAVVLIVVVPIMTVFGAAALPCLEGGAAVRIQGSSMGSASPGSLAVDPPGRPRIVPVVATSSSSVAPRARRSCTVFVAVKTGDGQIQVRTRWRRKRQGRPHLRRACPHRHGGLPLDPVRRIPPGWSSLHPARMGAPHGRPRRNDRGQLPRQGSG